MQTNIRFVKSASQFLTTAWKSYDKDGSLHLRYVCCYSVIEKYNMRGITYAADKLPALAGLAINIQDIMKSDSIKNKCKENNFLARLWSHDLTAGYVEYQLWISIL